MLDKPQTLTVQVAQALLSRIEGGVYPVGAKLPSGRVLAAEFGVSAAVIREATERLRAQGLIDSRQGAGCTVRARTAAAGFSVPVGTMADRDELARVFELRIDLEGAAAALAARRRTDSDLRTMQGHLDALARSLYHPTEAVEHDLAFHVAIASATGNAYYRGLLQYLNLQLRAAVQAARSNTLRRDPGRSEAVHREHLAIYEAIRAADPDAAREAAVAHLRGASARLELALP